MARCNVLVLLLAFAASSVLAQDRIMPRLIDHYALPHAAFVQLFPTENPNVDPQDNFTLFISRFDPLALFQPDSIYYLRSPGKKINDASSWVMSEIDLENYWPNDLNYMPSSVVGTEGIIWTSGFLVPSKTKGKLNIYLTDSDPLDGPYNIATLDDNEYSYHRVIWTDVNGDGKIDAVSARFHKSVIGGTAKHLLWFENPGNGPSEGWTQHMIFNGGPDVHFRLTTIPAGGRDYRVLVGAEFFNEQLTFYYSEDGSENFLGDPTKLVQLIIDKTPGQTFDVDVVDLNRDGKLEVLLTGYNHTLGNVYVYPIPDDFRSQPFQRITIADGFKPNNVIGGQAMSPGAAHPFYKSKEHENSGAKPYVFVSGDDDGVHYILSPDSEDKDNWSYTKHVLLDTTETTTGKYAIADIDNDGYNDIIAAAYTAGEVYVYTYAP